MPGYALFPGPKAGRRDLAMFVGKVTLGSSGAISSQTAQSKSGFTVTHIGTGKYRVTFPRTLAELCAIHVAVIGANATYSAVKGLLFYVVTDGIATYAQKYIEFQMLTVGSAVAVPEDSAKLLIRITAALAT